MLPNYGERLRRAREQSGLTKVELAAAIGKSESVLRQYEAGAVQWWRRMKTVLALADALGTSTDALIGVDADPVIHPQSEPIGKDLAALLLDLLEDPEASGPHKKAARQTIEIALGLKT